MAKAALRRLAMEKLEPTPENYSRAYLLEAGGQPPPVFPTAALPMLERLVSRALSDAQLVERHRAQLTGYRILLAELYAGKPVHAALLLADGRLVDMMSG